MCVGAFWEKLAIDITGPHPLFKKGNKFIITIIEHFTKYGLAFPVKNHEAKTVAKYLVEKVFLIYGVPMQLLLDRGAEFEGMIFKEICDLLGVDKPDHCLQAAHQSSYRKDALYTEYDAREGGG